MKLFASIFLLFLTQYLVAQQYDFKSYTTKNGLPNDQVFDILQAKDKQLWIATLGGVSSFDGKEFTIYNKKNGLVSNTILSVFEDSKGRIWAGAVDNGFSIIEKGKIVDPKQIDYFKYGSINEFYEDKEGTIYIVANKGIIAYKNNAYKTIVEEEIFGMDIAKINDDEIYIASTKRGLLKLNLKTFKIHEINQETHGINNICYSVFIDDDKTVWIGSFGALYKLKDNKITEFVPNSKDFNSNRIWSIKAKDQNTLVLTTEGNGFLYFNKTTGQFNTINKHNGLPSNYIYKSTIDSENNLWLATYKGGLVKFRNTAFKYLNTEAGLPTNTINDYVFWNDFDVLATNKGLLFYKNNQLVKTLFNSSIIDNIRTSKDLSNLLVLTNEKAIEIDASFNFKTLNKGAFFDIYQDQNNTFIVGVNALNITTKDSSYTMTPFRRSFKTIPIGNRYIFVKSYGLLQFKNGKQDTIPGLHPSKYKIWKSIESINDNEVIALNEDYLFHIELKDEKFNSKKYSLDLLSPLKNITYIKRKGDVLWIKSENAYSELQWQKLLSDNEVDLKIYKNNNQFINNNENDNFISFNSKDEIVTPTNNGLFVFNKKEYQNNNKAPLLALKEIELFSEQLIDSLYQTQQGIVLPYQKNYLTFSMSAITFTNPEDVHYKYRLKGLRNSEWSAPTKDNKVVFSYLPPGTYNFEFTADNGNGIWQTTPYVYSFQIKKPFWAKISFWTICLFLTTILVFGIVLIRNKAKSKRQKLFAQQLIKTQENERARLAGELHDGIGQKLILLKIKAQKQDVDLAIMTSSALEEMRAITKNLHPSILKQLGLTETLKQLVNTVDENTTPFFTFEIQSIDGCLSPENEVNLYRIIQECLNNIIKHAQATEVEITILKTANTIQVTVIDNGIGFNVEEQLHKGKSLGLQTLKERVQILNGKLHIISSNSGTTTKIQIPV